MDVFLYRLTIRIDDQGKQSAETLFGRIDDGGREAHHLAEGFIIQGMAGSQEAVVTGEGKHGPGIHVDQAGSEPEVVFQSHGVDDVEHHGRLIGKNLPADVDMLSTIVHEADHIFPEPDGQGRPALKSQHPAIGLVPDDVDQNPLLFGQFTFAAMEIAFHTTKVAVFYGKGNTNK